MFNSKMWSDCDGGILTTELVLVASFVTATLLAGLGALRSQVNSEFQQLSSSIQNANVQNVVNEMSVPEIGPQVISGTEFEAFDEWSE